MTPKEPYLIRAFHQWILDNDCTPYIVVDTYQDDVLVPQNYVQPDGQITLNISPAATGNLALGDTAIEFAARFGGKPHHLYIPCRAVLAIFAKETGEGTGFAVRPPGEYEQEPVAPTAAAAKGPKLAAVKTEAEIEAEALSVDSDNKPTADDKPLGDDKPPKRKGSHLSVVK